MPPTTASPTSRMDPQTANAQAAQLLRAVGVEMFQPTGNITVNPAQQNPITFTLRNVGLLRSIFVSIVATIANTDGALDLTLTQIGLANLLSQIVLTDLANNQRVNVPGWYLSWLNSVRHRGPFGSGFALETDTMGGYGENFPVLAAPTTIAHGTTATVRAVYEIPVCYSPDDFRGGMLMNVTNANATLALQVNPAAFSAANTDSTFAVYKGTTSAAITSVTINMYQDYLDNLPRDNNGSFIVPALDLQTVYELKTSTVTGMTPNVEFGYQYPNYRDILSTLVIYNHDKSVDTGRSAGTDISYWALQSANFTNIWKRFPLEVALRTRQILECDFPVGGYHFSSRSKPISSLQYGNMNLVINPITAAAGAYLTVGLEMFNQPNIVVNAGSLQNG
jgi:hypothetical protein